MSQNTSRSNKGSRAPGSKAQYRSSVGSRAGSVAGRSAKSYRSSAARVAAAAQFMPSNLSTLDERNSDSAYPSEYQLSQQVQPRDAWKPPSDLAVQQLITDSQLYLRQTGVEEAFYSLLRLLLTLTDLPYNPYPGFVRRFRAKAERFHMFTKTDEEAVELIFTKYEKTHIAYIVCPVNCDFLWGMSGIAQVCDPGHLRQYEWLVDNLTPRGPLLVAEYGYSNQVMAALVGPAVFESSLYVVAHTISVRLEYLITGHTVEKAVQLFVDSVVKDVLHTDQDGLHVLLGVNVPEFKENTDSWYLRYWTMDQIQEDKDYFTQLIGNAVTGNKYVYAECMFCVDNQSRVYRRGQKQYGLNFVKLATGGQDEGISFFTEFPLITLHEGIFYHQSQAEAYISIFTPRVELMDKDTAQNSNTASRGSTASSSSSGAPPPSTWMPWKRSQQVKAPTKVRVDGFKLQDAKGHNPNAWEVMALIKASWQKKIAGFDKHAEVFELVHYALLMELMDGQSYDEKLLVEIWRLLRSTAARLYHLMQLNKTLRELVLKFEGASLSYVFQESESELVTDVFLQYRDALTQLFDNSLQERSTDLMTGSRAVVRALQELTTSPEGFTDVIPLNRRTLEQLKKLNAYTYTMMLGLVEDALQHCPAITELMEKMWETFPEAVQRPSTPQRARQDKFRTGVRAGEGDGTYSHGFEDEHIMKHDDLVVNVSMCMERDNAPKVISVESVLLKYMTDTHLDRVWPSFLVDLLCGASLPPNPFPRMVSTFRQCAMRMDLCYESREKLQERLLQANERPEDGENHVYHIPGCDAHGMKTAMSLLDTGMFHQLAPLVSQFIQTDFKMRHGPYRIALCCAVSGSTPLYGKLDPYLREIVLHEHCYIRGPQGCWGEALQLYSKIVWSHILDMYKKAQYFIVGLYMGEYEERWTVEDVLNRKKAYASEIERNIAMKEPIYVKLYAQMGTWRLVPIVKHFKYHFINDEETKFEVFYPENHANLYQNVFLDKEKAAFHYQYGGPADRSNPYNTSNIRVASRDIDRVSLALSRRQDWLNCYRWLLLRNTINEGTSLIADVWRMLHSMAAQIEYVCSLAQGLEDLVKYAMELDARTKREATYYNVTTENDDADQLLRLEGMLARMVMAYRQKVESICYSQASMAPRSLARAITTKLQGIMERDEVTRELFIIASMKAYFYQTVFILEEVTWMMRAIQDSLSYDIHTSSDEAQALLRSMEAESHQRPGSVASIHLDHPDQYLSLPLARQPDHVDEWVRT